MAGSHLPVEVQLLAYEMNRLLGAIGSTINYIEVETSAENIFSLESKISDGSIERLVILGGNPFTKPKVLLTGRICRRSLEICELASVHQLMKVPGLLTFTWGNPLSRVMGFGQNPGSFLYCASSCLSLLPLFDTITEASLLSHLVGENEDDHSLTENLHGQFSKGSNFKDFLRLGVLATKPVIASPLDASEGYVLSVESRGGLEISQAYG